MDKWKVNNGKTNEKKKKLEMKRTKNWKKENVDENGRNKRQWTIVMDNEQQTLNNERYTIENWTMNHGQWEMRNEQWKENVEETNFNEKNKRLEIRTIRKMEEKRQHEVEKNQYKKILVGTSGQPYAVHMKMLSILTK